MTLCCAIAPRVATAVMRKIEKSLLFHASSADGFALFAFKPRVIQRPMTALVDASYPLETSARRTSAAAWHRVVPSAVRPPALLPLT